MKRTNLQGAADRRTASQHGELAEQLRNMAADAGITRRVLATTSGLSAGYVTDVLAGSQSPTLEAYHRLAAALGADLAVKLYANTGPNIRDRWQAPMLEEVLRVRNPRWDPSVEALVTRPVQGWIDLVLHERREQLLLATELQSEMRRLEQLIRWQASKAAALPSWGGFVHLGEAPRVSQLMIVRRTRATRAVAAQNERQLRAAFPAHPDDAIAALTGTSPWPGAALAWMVVDANGARLVPGR